ncbi:MAG TPA: TIGR04211 family SH3 domain-containing protein [Povalibacter sp.]
MGSTYGKNCLVVATALVLLSMGVAAQEEPAQLQPAPRLFVSDRLVLNVYAEPEQGGERVATIETGDAVNELERTGSFVRVRLAGGQEGWVGANYLTSDMPAATRLRELQTEQQAGTAAAEKSSAGEIARLKKEATTLQAQVSELKAAASAASAATLARSSTEGAPIAQGTETNALQPMPAASPDAGIRPWMLMSAVVLSIGAGFGAGYQTLARRIRRRFGRLKIY